MKTKQKGFFRYTKKSDQTTGTYTSLCVELDKVLQKNMMENAPKTREKVVLPRLNDDIMTIDEVSSSYEVRDDIGYNQYKSDNMILKTVGCTVESGIMNIIQHEES